MAKRRTDRRYSHEAHYEMLPLKTTVREFSQWVATAPPFEQVVYHQGHLLTTRYKIFDVVRLAMKKYREGLIELTQYRVVEDRYLYIATKRETKARGLDYA